jgi:hypothetical protein
VWACVCVWVAAKALVRALCGDFEHVEIRNIGVCVCGCVRMYICVWVYGCMGMCVYVHGWQRRPSFGRFVAISSMWKFGI